MHKEHVFDLNLDEREIVKQQDMLRICASVWW